MQEELKTSQEIEQFKRQNTIETYSSHRSSLQMSNNNLVFTLLSFPKQLNIQSYDMIQRFKNKIFKS